MNISFWILVLIIAIEGIVALYTENDCPTQDTCEKCLNVHLKCAWCTDKKYDINYRCMTYAQLVESGCAENEIYENESEQLIIMDSPVKDYESSDDRAMQVQPQRVYLRLVKSHTQRVKLKYRPARNNPLDLYILMDLTWTMRDDKQTLVELGVELAAALRQLTVNYRLGFGSFADKPIWPIIMPYMKQNPCAAEHQVCEPTYGFRHKLRLTDDIRAFVQSVNTSQITGNLDNLEGGFDALMQVLVCPNEIGWKDEARKIVILVTDGFMHFAGDGLLAGISQPNDKQCHLDEKGEYTGSLEFDYPSLEEIYRELQHRKVNVIFAVTAGVVNTYKELSNLISDVSNVEILSTDSSNILDLISKSYARFIKRAQFVDDSPAYIKVEYETDCGGQYSTLRKRNYCNNVEMGREVDFFINITLVDYPTDGVYNHKIRIEESSLNEFMELTVDIQKPCPCAETVDNQDDDRRRQCSYNGHLNCGMCVCDEGWAGTYCSCPLYSMNATTNDAIENLCRPKFKDSELGQVCSNRGQCDCGSCACFTGFTGKYCECPECDISCNLEHADCICGKCVCKYGWSGDQCDCSESNDDCIGPTSDICSEHGLCQCNKCVCNEAYRGHFCEIGLGTENKLCAFYEPCVTCLIEQKLGTGICHNLTDVCSSAEENKHYTHAFVTEAIESDEKCLVRLQNKHGIVCDHYFSYQSLGPTENYLLIWVADCGPVNYYALVGMLSLVTFLLGFIILIIIWCWIRASDAREYARFEQQQRHSVLNESPIYKDPMRHYEVPKLINKAPSNPFL